MRDSKRFLRREAIERISRLDLRARAIVEGFLSGLHRSPYFGQSLEFRQHREYAIGDDPRHVDWKVWARQDRMYVKQYEEDTNLRCYLLVDVSKSMNYGQGDASKFHYAATLASCLAYLILRQQDAAGCLFFDQNVRQVVPARTGRAHLQAIVSGLTQASLQEKTDMLPVLRQVTESFPRRGMVILMTDAFAPREGLFKGLRLLRQRGHDVSLFHVLHDDELDFSFTGPTRFDDLESPTHITCNPRSLRDGYLQAMQEFLQQIRRGCARIAVDYSLVRSSDPPDAALATYLARRQRARAGRM